MAILNKGGQLLANATQRTVVLETEQQRAEFLASLPSGVNIEESFDIYVKETATVYAAGEPFKLRTTLPGGGNTGEGGGDDNPPDVDGDTIGFEVWFSPTGTGDGFSAENPAPNTELNTKLNDLAAMYDFGGLWVKAHLASGDYPNIRLKNQFYNCAGLKIVADGTALIVPENADPTVYVEKALNLKLVGVEIQEKDSAVYVTDASVVLLDGVKFYLADNQVITTGRDGLVVADGCGATVLLRGVQFAGTQNSREHLFLATRGGIVRVFDGSPLDWLDSAPVALAIVLGEKHGVVDFRGGTGNVSSTATVVKLISGASLYLDDTTEKMLFKVVCDNQSYIVEGR